MYELARGPLMWVATLIFVVGVIYRMIQLFMITRKKEQAFCPAQPIGEKDSPSPSPEEQKLNRIISFQNSLLGKNPIMAIVSFVFHFCLFVTPIFALGHNQSCLQQYG